MWSKYLRYRLYCCQLKVSKVWKDEQFLHLVHNSVQHFLINLRTSPRQEGVNAGNGRLSEGSSYDVQLLQDVWAHCEVAIHIPRVRLAKMTQLLFGRIYDNTLSYVWPRVVDEKGPWIGLSGCFPFFRNCKIT